MHQSLLYNCLPFLPDYDVEMPDLVFYEERKQAMTKVYFAFWTWVWSLGIQFQEGSCTFDKVSRNNRDKDWKNANSLFKRRSRCCRVVGSYSPYWLCGTQLGSSFLLFSKETNCYILLGNTWRYSPGQHFFRRLWQWDAKTPFAKLTSN